jgi:antirestriction protein
MTTETVTTHDGPAAWIGCLACYNRGTLRGQWVTAQDAAADVAEAERTDGTLTYNRQAQPATYPNGVNYSACVACGGDEFDVFDTIHVPYTSLTLRAFYQDAEQLADLDNAGDLDRLLILAQWIGGSYDLDDLASYDADHYYGQYDTWRDFAEQYADDTGDLSAMPEHLVRYFDYDAYARDLAHDFYHCETTGHVWRSA